MPNNSSARQKKQSKKKKTVPLPLHKEDRANKADATIKDSASQDTSALPLSLAGRDKASKDSDSLVGKDGAPDLSDPRYLEKTLAARRMDKASTMDQASTVDRTSMDKASLDGSSLSLVGTKMRRTS
jgi:hypothetical protein